MLHLDYCVIGGGVVGLAVAAALAPFGSVAVLERNTRLIQETSSRNSGVVHSGLYYPADSLKTQLCMAGNRNMWHLQQKFPDAVTARRIGKWIGSCDASENAKLEELIQKMKDRQIPYEMVPRQRARQEEPLVQMETIVNSTSTGIVDVHTLADFYRNVVEQSADGYVLCGSDVTRLEIPSNTFTRGAAKAPVRVTVANTSSSNGETYDIDVDKAVICAAGLHANTLWSRLFCDGVAVQQPPSHRLYACKGRYAGYRGTAPVSRLVYPCPLPNLVGLGVHSVVDVAGQVRFGPDAVYVDSFDDVAVAESAAAEAAFLDSQYDAVRRYVPSIERARFFADFAGVRPKLARAGEGFRDFLIEYIDGVMEEATSGDTASSGDDVKDSRASTSHSGSLLKPTMKAVNGELSSGREGAAVVWLNGIESPGLTASSAIGDYVTSWLVGQSAFDKHLPPWRA